jgi:hypothetical protein
LGLPVALFLLAAAIALAAVGDHWYKQHRIERIELAFWYCRHEGTRCEAADRPLALGIERRWNERQVGYEVAVGITAAAAAVLGWARLRRR